MKSATLARSIDASVCRYVDLDEFTDLLPAQFLSERECERADGFRFAADKQRFVAAHIALRQVLSAHTGLPADALDFAVGAFGKPSLPGRPRTQFSMSHSQGLALIAIGGRGPLGADIELLRRVPDAAALAARHFTRRPARA